MSEEKQKQEETISKRVCAIEVVNRLRNNNFYLFIISTLLFIAFISSPLDFYVSIIFLIIAIFLSISLYLQNKNEIERLKNKYNI
ncbi:MAG: hypothetical protein QW184_01305 [Nanopusillaceae archaeon]